MVSAEVVGFTDEDGGAVDFVGEGIISDVLLPEIEESGETLAVELDIFVDSDETGVLVALDGCVVGDGVMVEFVAVGECVAGD